MIEIPKKEPLNIVPFIDIMLVLLAMVLSISTFIAKGEIKINLPASKTASQAENVKAPLLVQVDAAGDFFRDGTRVSFEELAEAIAGIPRDKPVLLRMDRESKFEHFIRVIDLLKEHQHVNFRIATERKDG